MKLNIPAEKAIKILRNRLGEIDGYGFNPKAWKDQTENDLREIFPIGSIQWLQVSGINFETFVTSEKPKVLAEGKDTAKKLIASFIEFISEYSTIAEEKQIIKNKDFEQKFYDLIKKWNDLVPGYNSLVNKYDDQLTTAQGLLENIQTKDQEIERIKSETIQLDNVSFKKLWTALFSLPTGQLIGVFSTLGALLIGAFTLGTLYERTSANNELFDLRSSQKQMQEQNEKMKFSYDSLQKATTIKLDTTLSSKLK